MNNNIEYNHRENDIIRSSNEVIKDKAGDCHDQTLFEIATLSNIIPIKNIHYLAMAEYADNKSKWGQTHSLVFYELNDKCYWFEHAWYDEAGIKEYANKSELIKDIKKKWPFSKGYDKLLIKEIPLNLIKSGDSLSNWCKKVAYY